MLELEHKEGWRLKNWYFQIVVLEKTLQSSLDCKELKPVNPKRNPPWIFIGRTDAEADDPILWSPDGKNQLIGKDPDAGKDWRQKKRAAEDKMVGWYHWLSGCEFEKLWEMVKDREACSAAVHWFAKSQTWLSNWTTTLLIIDYVEKPPILIQTVNLEENSHSNHFYTSSACLLAN